MARAAATLRGARYAPAQAARYIRVSRRCRAARLYYAPRDAVYTAPRRHVR